MRINIDFEVSPRAQRAMRWLLLPVLVLVGASSSAHAMLDPLPDTWVQPDQPISAKNLRQNLNDLNERVKALEAKRAVITKGTESYSLDATYCGHTASSSGTGYTGAGVGGYKGAKDKCKSAPGCSATSTTVHQCTSEEMIRSRMLGVFVETTTSLWISTGTRGDAVGSGAPIFDCGGWTNSSAGNAGVVWEAGSYPDVVSCEKSREIACCD